MPFLPALRSALFVLLFALAAVSLAGPGSRAAETTLPAIGGPGGDPYRLVCAPGTYLAGFRALVGDWINQLTMVCATPQGKETRGPFVGRGGGMLSGATCLEGFAIQHASFTTLRSQNGLLDNLKFGCIGLAAPFNIVGGVEINSNDSPSNATISFGARVDNTCPAGQAATGIHGRSGAFIDQIGLICNDIPGRTQPVSATCKSYAQMAVNQQSQNLKQKCGFSGVAWTATYADHAGWCMGAPAAARAAENNKRYQALIQCNKR